MLSERQNLRRGVRIVVKTSLQFTSPRLGERTSPGSGDSRVEQAQLAGAVEGVGAGQVLPACLGEHRELGFLTRKLPRG